jgi:hypothetical protein
MCSKCGCDDKRQPILCDGSESKGRYLGDKKRDKNPKISRRPASTSIFNYQSERPCPQSNHGENEKQIKAREIKR